MCVFSVPCCSACEEEAVQGGSEDEGEPGGPVLCVLRERRLGG